MGVFGGSISYVRFKVQGGVPNNFVEHFQNVLSLRRFVSLKPEGEDLESRGFVPLQKPYDDLLAITCEHFLFGERIALGYREDSFAFPKPLLKNLVAQKLDEYQQNAGREASSAVRKTIELAVRSELRSKVLPKTKIVDILWDISRSELRFFAKGKGLSERFMALFDQTFQNKLVPYTFAGLALDSNLSLADKGYLESLQPQEIFPMKTRTEVN